MQINQATLAALFKGYRTLYLAAMHGAEPQWSAIAMRTPSGSASEIYHWLGTVPGMKELIGEVVIDNLGASNWSIANKEFESTVGVKQADIERDSYGIYNPMFSAMGQAGAEHPDELVANLLDNGFATLDYTGKNFFDTNKLHEPGDNKSGKFTNLGTKKLAPSTYSTAKTALRSLKNSRGRPMGLGRKLQLVVSPDNEDTGKMILEAEKDAAGATNIYRGTAELVVFRRLSGPKWYLMEAGTPIKPIILQEEKATTLASLTSTESDHVFKKKEFLYQAYGRYNAGYGLSQLIYGSTGVDAP